MRHELLTQCALFCECKKGHAELAFCDACRTSSGMGLRAIIIHQIMNACSSKHALPNFNNL